MASITGCGSVRMPPLCPLCYGGLGQVIAGVMEWKKRNTFGTLAFTSYGLFWISLAFMLLLPAVTRSCPPIQTRARIPNQVGVTVR